MSQDTCEFTVAKVNENKTEDVGHGKKSKRILAQILAGTAISLFTLGLGAAMNVSTIIIASISSGTDHIKATENELSWIGSLAFIFQPIGSLASGIVMDPIGRKKVLFYINIPTILAWILTWLAKDVTTLYIANVLFGLGTGLLEAPTISYIGEICEPSVRGTILSYASVFTSTGLFGGYLLGTILPWRTMAAVCIGVPLITMLAVSMIPESPIWLLSKGREDDAIKALCWLRGWVQPSQVEEEFKYLRSYNQNNMRCNRCNPIVESRATSYVKNSCPHINQSPLRRFCQALGEMKQRETLRPIILVSLFFAFSTMTGFYSIKPNMINIFTAFNLSLDAHWATVGVGLTSIIGSILCCSLMKVIGKRPIALASMAGSCLSTLALAYYACKYLPHDISTFLEVHSTEKPTTVPLMFFFFFILCNTTGIIPISWIIASEVFPFTTRGYACGFAAGFCYIMTFVSTKTYIYMENSLHIHGALYVYSAITFVGLVYLYFALIETENRTHEDIEADFKDQNIKCFADDLVARKIKKMFKGRSNTYNVNRNYIND